MDCVNYYDSPLGRLTLASDGNRLTGLWFEEQKYYAENINHQEKDLPVFATTKKWLELYFSGRYPDFIPEIYLKGTDFQKNVWRELLKIPYGQTSTYGEIAQKLAKARGIAHMSAQAVGVAVGHNPISIIIPCHRIIGSKGNLVGYSGGLERKKQLLLLEEKYAVF